MCNRYSWIEKNGRVLFLTANDVLNTKDGDRLRKYNDYTEDWVGHGAIRYFYHNLKGGKECECTNFSSPKRFPEELVDAIKSGQMWGLGISLQMEEMLTDEALLEWRTQKEARAAVWRIHLDAINALRPGGPDLSTEEDRRWEKILLNSNIRYNNLLAQVWSGIWKVKKNRIRAWR